MGTQDNNNDEKVMVEISTRKLSTFTRKLNARKTQNAEDLFKTTVKREIKREENKGDEQK